MSNPNKKDPLDDYHITECSLNGCYYKIDGEVNQEDGSYYAKCQRCNKRTKFIDLAYKLRKEGKYSL